MELELVELVETRSTAPQQLQNASKPPVNWGASIMNERTVVRSESGVQTEQIRQLNVAEVEAVALRHIEMLETDGLDAERDEPRATGHTHRHTETPQTTDTGQQCVDGRLIHRLAHVICLESQSLQTGELTQSLHGPC